MLELFRDGIWQFIGAVLGLVAIIVSVWVYFQQKPKKRLLIERVARVPLITIGHGHIPGLQILFDGQAMNQATVVVVRVVNIGNAPITVLDYETPISLMFEDDAVVLDAQISETSPKSLAIETQSDQSILSMSKSLLNPGDSFVCRVLVRDSKGIYDPKARIVGMKDIETSRSVSIARPVTAFISLAMLAISFFLSPKPMSMGLTDIRAEELPYVLIASLSALLLGFVTLTDIRGKLKLTRERLMLLKVRDT